MPRRGNERRMTLQCSPRLDLRRRLVDGDVLCAAGLRRSTVECTAQTRHPLFVERSWHHDIAVAVQRATPIGTEAVHGIKPSTKGIAASIDLDEHFMVEKEVAGQDFSKAASPCAGCYPARASQRPPHQSERSHASLPAFLLCADRSHCCCRAGTNLFAAASKTSGLTSLTRSAMPITAPNALLASPNSSR